MTSVLDSTFGGLNVSVSNRLVSNEFIMCLRRLQRLNEIYKVQLRSKLDYEVAVCSFHRFER